MTEYEVMECVKETISKAYELFPVLEEKEFKYNVDLHSNNSVGNLGKCICYPYDNFFILEFNKNYWTQLPVEEYKETIIHEVAHMINYIITGTNGHNKSWKKIMEALGISNAKATTNYKIDKSYLLTPKKIMLYCKCDTHVMSKNIWNKNYGRYVCTKCKTDLSEVEYV